MLSYLVLRIANHVKKRITEQKIYTKYNINNKKKLQYKNYLCIFVNV